MKTAALPLLLSFLLLSAGCATPGRAPAAAANRDVAKRAPVPILRAFPVYPAALYRTGESGTVEVGFVVDKEGNVRDAHVIRASNQAFAAPALAAVRKWKFRPGMAHGRPVNTRLDVPITFTAPVRPPHPQSAAKPAHSSS